MDERLFEEIWTLKNTSEIVVEFVSGNTSLQFEDYGAKGKYSRRIVSNAPAKGLG